MVLVQNRLMNLAITFFSFLKSRSGDFSVFVFDSEHDSSGAVASGDKDAVRCDGKSTCDRDSACPVTILPKDFTCADINGNDKGYRNGLMCMDLDGNVKWKTKKSPGFEWGGLLLADGMLYVVDGPKGDLCLIKPDPSGYKEIARKNFLSGPEIWATIAMADGKVLIRDQKQLKCIDVKNK